MGKNISRRGTMSEDNATGNLARNASGLLKTEEKFRKDTTALAKHREKRRRRAKIARIARKRNRG